LNFRTWAGAHEKKYIAKQAVIIPMIMKNTLRIIVPLNVKKDTMGTGEKKSFCPDDGIRLPVTFYQTTNVVEGCE
jgi:hypothetical protein